MSTPQHTPRSIWRAFYDHIDPTGSLMLDITCSEVTTDDSELDTGPIHIWTSDVIDNWGAGEVVAHVSTPDHYLCPIVEWVA